jgi:hypothetical protein
MNGTMLMPALLLACAALPGTPELAAPPPAAAQDPLVPSGFGTLRQDAITVSLRDGSLLIKVTPLDEGIIRLLAPDTWRRLHALAEDRRAEAAGAAAEPAMFLVSFFSYQPNTAFNPENVHLSYQGRLLQPVAIHPLTAGFGRPVLEQQDNQSGIYVFDGRIDYQQRFVVRYGATDSNEWASIIPKLEVERAKVRARAGGG